MLTREQVVDTLSNHPLKFAHMLGFTKLTELHEQWIIDMVKGKEDTALMAHRASYKTTCVSIALSIIIILLPRIRTMFMRKTDADIKEVVKQVQNILQNEKTIYLVQCLYGVDLRLTTQAANEINTNLSVDTKGTSQLIGIGTGGSLTGKHFDRIFTDDIININDRISKAERERTKLIYQELQNIKNRGGRIYNTLTPWHKDDASVLMPKPKKYDYHATGLISDEEIEQLKQSMLPSLFAANYELVHIASEDVIFMNPQMDGDISMVQNGIMHLDSAFFGEDYTAWCVCAVHGGLIYILGKLRRKHVEDCYTAIKEDYTKTLCSKIYNEDNADKGMVAKELRKQDMKVVTYHESMNKHIKIVTYLYSMWRDVRFVEGTDAEFISQICDYTEDADHDDAPDSLATMCRIMQKKVKRTESDYTPLLL